MEKNLSYKNEIQWIKLWLAVWTMEYPLSPKESDLTALIIYRQRNLLTKKLNDIDLKELLLSSSYRQELQKLLKISESSFNFYLNALKKKEVFVDGKIINDLLPEDTLTFKFNKVGTI